MILVIFAFIAGAGTALSPCVLPVLPALLSAGAADGGFRRPVGIALGLGTTFAVTILGLSSLVDGIGLGSGVLRTLAIFALLAFGLTLIVPRLTAMVEAPLSRLARFGPKSKGKGFFSGLLVGGALGFVYTPCAGPILAAVITASSVSGARIAVGLAFSLGSAVVLLVLLLGAQRLLARVRKGAQRVHLQQVLGAIIVATAVVFFFNLDVKFDQYIASTIPNFNLASPLESSNAVKSRLAAITGKPRFTPQPVTANLKLPNLGVAPNFVGTQQWFNTPGNKPLSLAQLRGRVVLIDFWTYSCINCIRTLPYLEAWYKRYHTEGLTIVGIESPEFSFEKSASNVKNAIQTLGIKYPVVQDNNLATWHAWGNQYWPSDYLIDAKGNVRYATFGEGDYTQTEQAIRTLLKEAGHAPGALANPGHPIAPSQGNITSETYLGAARAAGWVTQPTLGTHTYKAPARLPTNSFAYGGTWKIGSQGVTAVNNATISLHFNAKEVYLVLTSPGRPRTINLKLNGEPIPPEIAGRDVVNSQVKVVAPRLYNLVSLPYVANFTLTLQVPAGVNGYAFTFG